MADAHFSGHIDEADLAEFDRRFNCGDYGPRSRSDALRESIRLSTQIMSALDATGIEFETERERRAAVTEAIRRMAYDT